MRYLFLVRHGRRDSNGDKQTEEVARKLAEVCHELPDIQQFSIKEVLTGSSMEAQQAATIFAKHLSSDQTANALLPVFCLPRLSPSEKGHNQYLPSKDDEAFAKQFKGFLHGKPVIFQTSEDDVKPETNALLMVSHQPYIGWLTYWILGKPVPVDRSELLCIAQEDPKKLLSRPRLLWVLTPSPPKSKDDAVQEDSTLKDIREKIKSKMDVAKVLGGLIIPGLGLFLSSLIDPTKLKGFTDLNRPLWALYSSVFFLLVALSLYLATIYAYDRLLMPPRFWPEKPSQGGRPGWLVGRPPSSATWVLYQNMMHVWAWLFMPATYGVVVGLALLAYFVLAPPLPFLFSIGLFLVFGVVISSIMLGFYYWHRPRLGTED